MKLGYLITAITLSVVLLIIAFQNIQTHATFVMFFSFQNMQMTLPVLFLTFVGMVSGALYTLAIQSALSAKRDKKRKDEMGEF